MSKENNNTAPPLSQNKRHPHTDSSGKGFTLVELIMVIVILGIIGAMGADFVSRAFKGFTDTDSRISIYEEGKIVLVRMEREIHNSIPNAIDDITLGGNPADLRFGMIDETAMLIGTNIFGMYQENAPTTTITDLTGGALAVGEIISIYNRNWGDFAGTTNQRLYAVVNPPGPPMSLSKNMPPPRSSPGKRYYAVDRAVRYSLNGTTLQRAQLKIHSSNLNSIVADLTNSATSPPQPMAKDVTALSFTYTAGTLTRNGVVAIDFTITRNGESIPFHKEVHIRNVP